MKNLEQLLFDIFELANRYSPDAQAKAAIAEFIEHNDLSKVGAIPDWFVTMLSHVRDSVPTNGRIKYIPEDSDGDITNLLAELEDLIPAKWDDYGEAIEITFGFGVLVYIGRMDASGRSASFQVNSIRRILWV